MIQNKHKFAFLLCMLLMTTTVFGASEAEYKKLAKTWTLNADGSQKFRYKMELTLFTHTAMNGTYGESFIVYNPQYQELKINSSYTKQKDGTIIKTPDNAFVEVLPRNAADAPAYNHLKEMVVVHTGLELGATIYLDYTVTSKPGYLPEVDIFEELLQSSPVKEYTLTIVTPEYRPSALPSLTVFANTHITRSKPYVSRIVWRQSSFKRMPSKFSAIVFRINSHAAYVATSKQSVLRNRSSWPLRKEIRKGVPLYTFSVHL